ncbi:MAG TPA: DNA mismatch repair endonuclease MutL [Thermomicrobiales bacterium]|nr:DNA mismatch repair endonuclease MutL [Thermomicrobiales bacterium]
MPISLLPPDLVGKIAAGEVVERPASAVKELVENALDAGARRVRVEVRAGGRELIRVADDGGGIPRDELPLALQQHATSKLRSAEELARVATLGFRGEALASLAAVARVTIVSRPPAAPGGHELAGHGAERAGPRPVACPPGTTVTVRDLFASVPARLKFLRAPATEHGVVARIVAAYALARPDVRFELVIEGRRALATDGAGDRLNALVSVYGAEVAAQMLPLDPAAPEVPGVTVGGYVSAPALSRAHRQGITLFVNGRWVQNRALGFALEEAYHSLLMIGRHPIAVVDIALPPELVDVNVHPTKSEVRFLDERAVGRAVSRATRAAILAHGHAAVPGFSLGANGAGARPLFHHDAGPAPAQPRLALDPTGRDAPPDAASHAPPPARDDRPVGEPPPTAAPPGRLPPLRVLGQVGLSYIVAEGPDGVFLIDQHAAHERILLDRLLAGAERAAPDAQLLLEPLVLELTPPQAEALEACAGELAALGFAVEPFGGRAYAVRAVPAALTGRTRNLAETVGALLEEAAQGGQGLSWLERLASVTACHSAIRANQALSLDEMRALVGQLERTTLPRTCAHGRPTMLQVGLGELALQFGRHG